MNRANTTGTDNEKNIVLVFGADNNFAMPLAVTLFSAVCNLKKNRKPVIYIIDGGISEYKKKQIEKVLIRTRRQYKLIWVPFKLENISAVNANSVLTKAAYLRVFIPDLIPQIHSKAIYLDCDMIVEADLSTVWDIQFEGEAAMGVQDFNYPFIENVREITELDSLPVSAKAPYCNSGFIVMNLNYWRKNNLKEKIFDYLEKNSRSRLFDQDGINVILAGNWKLLDPRWNVTLSSLPCYGKFLNISQKEIDRHVFHFKSNAYIIHYTSRHKPWHSGHKNFEALNVFYFDQLFRDRFFYYLRKSGWFSRIRFEVWSYYRKTVLALEFKLPRRLGMFSEKSVFTQKIRSRENP